MGTQTVSYLDRYRTIQAAQRGRVLTLTLNRPRSLNSVDATMHRELSTIFDEINRDPGIDIVVLTGAGRAFSAGGDSHWMTELIDVPGEWQRKAVESRRLWVSLLDLEKLLIGRLNGVAQGMCATILSLCDVVIASEDATLADTHLNMALAATDGCHSIWPFRLGFQKTKDLLLNATSLTAQEALNLGLVQYVVPAAELDAAVERYVHSLQQRSIRALQWTKMAVNFQMKQIVLPALENGLNLLEMSNFAPDHREAVAAFNEKRAPRFPVPPDRREPE